MPSLQRQMTAKRAWSELTRQRNEAFNVGYVTALKLAYDRQMITEDDVAELLAQLEPHEAAWALQRIPQPLDNQRKCLNQTVTNPHSCQLFST